MTNIRRLTAGIALASCTVASTSALAEVSFNAGWSSEYYFRGIRQNESSAFAGADFEQGGFYLGTWAADVGDGLEVDLYGGYGIETEAGLSASVGYTGYFYTGDFDDTYQEINLGAGFGMLSVGLSIGEYDNFGGPTQDYTFLEATLEHEGFYGTVGSFGDDFDGEYLELGYGFSVADELDIGISAIFSSEELVEGLDADGDTDSSEAIILTISKSW